MGDISSEPTMEEILSSIKKIIAEDGDKSLSAARPRRTIPRDASHDELGNAVSVLSHGPRRDDVLELTEMADEDATTFVASPQVLADAVAAAPPPVSAAAQPVAAAPDIVSEVTVAASRSALESLSALIVKPEVTGSDTLEGMVREMLRPMLKQWLDANLPEVVERVVAKEVARISGR
jgi:uncharacterized protein